jgi:hypothetical protein
MNNLDSAGPATAERRQAHRVASKHLANALKLAFPLPLPGVFNDRPGGADRRSDFAPR